MYVHVKHEVWYLSDVSIRLDGYLSCLRRRSVDEPRVDAARLSIGEGERHLGFVLLEGAVAVEVGHRFFCSKFFIQLASSFLVLKLMSIFSGPLGVSMLRENNQRLFLVPLTRRGSQTPLCSDWGLDAHQPLELFPDVHTANKQ
jgi:hypothetical protein